MIVSIGLGPRFRIGALGDGRAIDLRLQDLILPIAALIGFASVRSARLRGGRWVWGRWFLVAGYSAVLVTIVHLLINQDIDIIRRLAFLGRHLMPFALAVVVAILYCQIGDRAGKLALRILVVVVAANTAWFAYQVLTGQSIVLIGKTAGDQIGSYGPKLVGEPSSAGAGAFFAFAAALALAAYQAGVMRGSSAAPLFVAAGACAYLAESRTALVSIVALALLFVVQANQSRLTLASRIALVGVIGAGAVWYAVGHQVERLSADGLNRGAQGRLQEIWAPLFHRADGDPLFLFLGAGPGALPSSAVPMVEAHSIYLRAWLDFGLIGAAVLLVTLSIVAGRAGRAASNPDNEPSLRLYAGLAFRYSIVMAITGIAQDSLTTVTSTHLLMLALGLFAGEYATRDSGPGIRSSGLSAAKMFNMKIREYASQGS